MLELRARKRMVATIHGIQTHGRWQKEVSRELAENDLVPVHVDYGFFWVLSFFLFFTREKQINKVRSQLRTLYKQHGPVNIIAHSFGTYIAMEALMREQGEITYNRVVLTGSIVRRDFPWGEVFGKKWVTAVRNERADGDWVVSLASWASKKYVKIVSRLNAGDSGKHEFLESHNSLVDRLITGEHSSTHNDLKYERWANFLAYPCLPKPSVDKLRKELQLFVQEAAGLLGVDEKCLRSNYFSLFGDALHIVPGASVNMLYAPEFGISIEVGHGGTGKAYLEMNPYLVLKNSDRWTHDLPNDELQKVCPGLSWIISLPVVDLERNRVYGVVNIDGICDVPEKLRNEPELLLFSAQMIAEQRIRGIMERTYEGAVYNAAGGVA